MPLPNPKPTESNNQFIQRCIIDDTMLSEYPDRRQRYAVCVSISTNKTVLNKQQKRKIGKQFEKQIRIAMKKNYPIAYQFYIKGYEKALEMFKENPSPNNPNFNTLFTENEVKEMYKQMYRQTGLRFNLWYRDKFKMFVEKQVTQYEADRILDRAEVMTNLSPSEQTNLESTIIEGMDRYADNREGYLALVKEVSAVNGVAIETLRKVITKFIEDEDFMSLGLEQRTTILMKELKFKSRWMARRIVQTETTGAANFAISDAASDLFGEDNLVKEWIAGGRNIRDTHAVASGQYQRKPIPVKDAYQVGGSLLMFPGDTGLGAQAKEVVNCKCVSIPFVDIG